MRFISGLRDRWLASSESLISAYWLATTSYTKFASRFTLPLNLSVFDSSAASFLVSFRLVSFPRRDSLQPTSVNAVAIIQVVKSLFMDIFLFSNALKSCSGLRGDVSVSQWHNNLIYRRNGLMAGGVRTRKRTNSRTHTSDKATPIVKPMLARIHPDAFDDRDWILENK